MSKILKFMWQRIQTIFLILAAVVLGLLFAPIMSFFTVSGTQDLVQQSEVNMLGDGIFNIQDHIIFSILTIIGILASIAAIFLFKNRTLQLTLSRLTLVMSILILILMGVFFYIDYQLITANSEVSGEFGILSPVLGIIFSALAGRGIKKDSELVRSSDRLR